MVWALRQSDPDNLLYSEDSNALEQMLSTIENFEHDFDPALNAFGCAKRYHEANMLSLRKDCEVQLALLESRLSQHSFLFGEKESLVDIALVPFLRNLPALISSGSGMRPIRSCVHGLTIICRARCFQR
ncbi:glutathione S-transferase N terminus [Vibrio maritimus]|uniref:Glutathione S-transferase N terminus n=1 Tax=Vibrio maritimus TaxID=990268 RepID=A0A090S3U6_9VIBR|nr:glutathione S-transferase N terminus [Vibrio maritimus]